MTSILRGEKNRNPHALEVTVANETQYFAVRRALSSLPSRKRPPVIVVTNDALYRRFDDLRGDECYLFPQG